ncbi:hypothetical protein BH09PLA1_BH09PLA1_02750 [soil metagenome]
MIVALWIVGTLIGLIAVIVIVGMMLPQNHMATRRMQIDAPPETVFAVITNWREFPSWRSGLKSVAARESEAGRMSWIETSGQGAMPLEVIETNSPTRLVTKIADPSLPFGGTWTWEIQPDANGSRVTVTEAGEIYNPVFRFMARFVFGYEATMKGVLSDLERKFGANR